ncbi:MAG TPA: DUF5684 domain-containing protein [Candidatus Sabulitectum sp.]|nr:DUF5684 domain-containing protein [Candidatus Sabulitectum sp.]
MKKILGLSTVALVLLLFTGTAVAKQSGSGAEAALVALPMVIFGIVVGLFMIICQWKIIEKAGKPGWAAIIPIYNVIVMLQIAGKPEWWFLLLLVPVANVIIAIITIIALAEKFGQETGFAIGMLLLPIIFYPILAFGDAKYQG